MSTHGAEGVVVHAPRNRVLYDPARDWYLAWWVRVLPLPTVAPTYPVTPDRRRWRVLPVAMFHQLRVMLALPDLGGAILSTDPEPLEWREDEQSLVMAERGGDHERRDHSRP